MDPDFVILDVHQYRNPNGRLKKNLIFRIQWVESGDVAFMHYEIARRKYPHILADYFAARVIQITPEEEEQILQGESPESEEKRVSDFSIPNENTTGQERREKNRLQEFFDNCWKCSFQKEKRLVDYDQKPISFDQPIGSPVFFKVEPSSRQKSRKKTSPPKPRKKNHKNF